MLRRLLCLFLKEGEGERDGDGECLWESDCREPLMVVPLRRY